MVHSGLIRFLTGTYKVVIWHPYVGEKSLEVTVSAGKTAKIEASLPWVYAREKSLVITGQVAERGENKTFLLEKTYVLYEVAVFLVFKAGFVACDIVPLVNGCGWNRSEN